ncbi:MAG: glycerol-3-phosphate acyltransferase [Chloroflexi bacterium]|nr:glycerol-3-phosphate acyltransferase [Chloroflexota bacterium]
MNTFATYTAVLLSAYLAGSVPSAYLVTRLLKRRDIREVGSGNPGALNVFRHVGLRAGVAVLGIDAAKGAAVILTIGGLGLGDGAMFAGALAVVVGHNWPVFLGFRGGKGAAAVFGISFAVLPLWTLLGVGLALGAGTATRSFIFGVGVGIVAINVATIATSQGTGQIALCLLLSGLIVATHYAIAYRAVVASVRQRGIWGLFEPE